MTSQLVDVSCQVELMEDHEEKVHKGKVPIIKGRVPPMSSRSQISG